MTRHRHLLSICDWLPPDFGAVGQYALADARRRAAKGAWVTLVGLSSQAGSVEEEVVGDGRLRVVRLAARPYDRSRLLRRALWTAATNRALLRTAAPFASQADEILISGSPPLFLHWIVPEVARLRKRLVYRITDFHPECLIAERSARGSPPFWLRQLLRRTQRLRRLVDGFEVLGEDQRQRLLEMGIPENRIVLRRDGSPVEISTATEPLPMPAELAGKAVLLYSGNFGMAHDDATFVEGYERHHRAGSGAVVLWLNATGPKADRVESELRRRGLPVHRTRPVPLADLARLLVTPHAHLITLRDEFVGYVMPSKVYGCVASGRRILFVGSERSDVDLICRERAADRYHRIEVGDSAGVAAALEETAAFAVKRVQ